MDNKLVRFIILGLIGFGLGGAFAVFEGYGLSDDAPKAQSVKSVDAIPKTKPISAVGGSFMLTSEDGTVVTEKTWSDQHKLVFFGFTHCPDVCPAALEKITIALEDLGEESEMIAPLFITVDPARDTPEIMAEYTDRYDSQIIGLTGTQEQVDKAIKAYKVYAAKDEETEVNVNKDSHMYMMLHSSYIYLMTPDDQLLKVIKTDDTAADISTAISAALLESTAGDDTEFSDDTEATKQDL